MTEEEFKKVPFRFVGSLSMAEEHAMTYSSKDEHLGFCVHTKTNRYGGFGRSYTHWRIGNVVYKSKKKFLEALKDYNPS